MRTPKVTYANVTATLALFLSAGGGAYAAIALSPHSVGVRELRAGAVNQSGLAFALGGRGIVPTPEGRAVYGHEPSVHAARIWNVLNMRQTLVSSSGRTPTRCRLSSGDLTAFARHGSDPRGTGTVARNGLGASKSSTAKRASPSADSTGFVGAMCLHLAIKDFVHAGRADARPFPSTSPRMSTAFVFNAGQAKSALPLPTPITGSRSGGGRRPSVAQGVPSRARARPCRPARRGGGGRRTTWGGPTATGGRYRWARPRRLGWGSRRRRRGANGQQRCEPDDEGPSEPSQSRAHSRDLVSNRLITPSARNEQYWIPSLNSPT